MISKKTKIISWVTSTIAALIMLQTLFFKFSASPESIFIFETMGVEPWGRWLSGFGELIASILILIPSQRAIGALIGAGIMAGAILSHLTVLGIVVMNDSGQLFIYALITFIFCIFNAWLFRKQLPFIGNIL